MKDLEKCAEAAYTTFYLSSGGTHNGKCLPLWHEMDPDHGLRSGWRRSVEVAIDMRNGRPKMPYDGEYINAVGLQNGHMADVFTEYVNGVYALDSEEDVAG